MRRASQRMKRQLGIVSSEIVVMLPLFVALFLAVYYWQRAVQTQIAAQQAARACAWEFAMSGCEARDTALCTDALATRGVSTNSRESGDARADQAEQVRRGVFDVLEDIPVVANLTVFLFGESAAAQASASYPAVLSEHTAIVSASSYLVCNTVVEPWEEKIKQSLCAVVDRLHLGSSDLFGCGT